MIHGLILAAALTTAQVDAVILGAEKAFGNYIYPDIAAKAVGMLKSNEHSYESINDPEDLTKRLDADLLAVTHDKHVRVYYPFDPGRMFGGSTGADPLATHHFGVAKNYLFDTVRRLPGNVGYVEFQGFFDDPGTTRALNAAMAFVADTDALIIDLRKNGGGGTATLETLEAYFFATQQQITSLIERDPKTGQLTEMQAYTAPTVSGSLYLDKPVYILTSSWTFSAAEQFTYDLHNLKRATIVGETTGGGANPGAFEPIAEKFAIFMPTGRAYSSVTKTNWEGSGIAPDVATPASDALLHAYELALTALKTKVQREDPNLLREFNQALKDPAAALQQ